MAINKIIEDFLDTYLWFAQWNLYSITLIFLILHLVCDPVMGDNGKFVSVFLYLVDKVNNFQSLDSYTCKGLLHGSQSILLIWHFADDMLTDFG